MTIGATATVGYSTYLNLQSAQGHPASNERTGVVRSTTERDENGAILGMCYLGNQERGAPKNYAVPKSNEQTGSNEHAKTSGTGLQTHGKQHNEASNKTAEPAAESIDHVRHYEQTDQ